MALRLLEGSIGQAPAISGSMALHTELAGTISAAPTISGSLPVPLALEGSISAAPTISGEARATLALAGTLAGLAATLAGEASLAKELSGKPITAPAVIEGGPMEVKGPAIAASGSSNIAYEEGPA